MKKEFDASSLSTSVREKFREKFGEDSVLDVSSQKFANEYDITIRVPEKTDDIRKYSYQLEDELEEKGVNAIIIVKEKGKDKFRHGAG